jgi:hypothetical protein
MSQNTPKTASWLMVLSQLGASASPVTPGTMSQLGEFWLYRAIKCWFMAMSQTVSQLRENPDAEVSSIASWLICRGRWASLDRGGVCNGI